MKIKKKSLNLKSKSTETVKWKCSMTESCKNVRKCKGRCDGTMVKKKKIVYSGKTNFVDTVPPCC